jgi:hypothetical protein
MSKNILLHRHKHVYYYNYVEAGKSVSGEAGWLSAPPLVRHLVTYPSKVRLVRAVMRLDSARSCDNRDFPDGRW